MNTLFLICATIGGTILLLQVVLSLLGLGLDSFAGHLGDLGAHAADAGGVDVSHGGHAGPVGDHGGPDLPGDHGGQGPPPVDQRHQ